MNKKMSLVLVGLLLLCGCENFNLGSGNVSSSSSKFSSESLSTSSNESITTSSSSVATSSSSTTTSSSSNLSSQVSSSDKHSSSSSEEEKYIDILNSSWGAYAEGASTISMEYIDNNSFILYINNVDATAKHSTQCKMDNLSVVEGTTYYVEMTLMSSITRTIRLICQEGTYSYYDLNEYIYLEANVEKEISLQFIAQESKDNMLFGLMTGKVEEGYEGEQVLTVKNPRVLRKADNEDVTPPTPSVPNPDNSPEKEGYTLHWSDEFDGTEVNKNNWTFEIGHGDNGWGNNEYQYYTDREENAFVKDGFLNIVARKESYQGARYTSARMITQNKVNIHYGYIEARIALPSMQGIWPAFWMLGSNFKDVGWPRCGEIDILEAINNEKNKTYATLHWYNTSGKHQADHGNGGKYVNDRTQYHLYAMNWTNTKIEIYVDNVKTFEMGIDGGNGLEAFQKPHFFIMNVAVGGNWPGFTIAESFPQTMSVDYIRVYKPNN